MKMKLSVWFCLAFLVCSSNAAVVVHEIDYGVTYITQFDFFPYGGQHVAHINTYDMNNDFKATGFLFYEPDSGFVKIITFFNFLRVLEFQWSPYIFLYGYWGVGLRSGKTPLSINLNALSVSDNYAPNRIAGSAPKDLSAASEHHRINSPALIEAFQTVESASRDVTLSSAGAVLRGEVEGTPYVYLFYLYDAFRVNNNGVNLFTMIVELYYNGEQVGTTDGLLFFQEKAGFYDCIFTWFGNDVLNSMSAASTSFHPGRNNEAKLIAHNGADLTMLFGVRQ